MLWGYYGAILIFTRKILRPILFAGFLALSPAFAQDENGPPSELADKKTSKKTRKTLKEPRFEGHAEYGDSSVDKRRYPVDNAHYGGSKDLRLTQLKAERDRLSEAIRNLLDSASDRVLRERPEFQQHHYVYLQRKRLIEDEIEKLEGKKRDPAPDDLHLPLILRGLCDTSSVRPFYLENPKTAFQELVARVSLHYLLHRTFGDAIADIPDDSDFHAFLWTAPIRFVQTSDAAEVSISRHELGGQIIFASKEMPPMPEDFAALTKSLVPLRAKLGIEGEDASYPVEESSFKGESMSDWVQANGSRKGALNRYLIPLLCGPYRVDLSRFPRYSGPGRLLHSLEHIWTLRGRDERITAETLAEALSIAPSEYDTFAELMNVRQRMSDRVTDEAWLRMNGVQSEVVMRLMEEVPRNWHPSASHLDRSLPGVIPRRLATGSLSFELSRFPTGTETSIAELFSELSERQMDLFFSQNPLSLPKKSLHALAALYAVLTSGGPLKDAPLSELARLLNYEAGYRNILSRPQDSPRLAGLTRFLKQHGIAAPSMGPRDARLARSVFSLLQTASVPVDTVSTGIGTPEVALATLAALMTPEDFQRSIVSENVLGLNPQRLATANIVGKVQARGMHGQDFIHAYKRKVGFDFENNTETVPIGEELAEDLRRILADEFEDRLGVIARLENEPRTRKVKMGPYEIRVEDGGELVSTQKLFAILRDRKLCARIAKASLEVPTMYTPPPREPPRRDWQHWQKPQQPPFPSMPMAPQGSNGDFQPVFPGQPLAPPQPGPPPMQFGPLGIEGARRSGAQPSFSNPMNGPPLNRAPLGGSGL